MTKTVAMIIGLAIVIPGLSLCAAGDEGRVEKPVWRVGDSWRVKCPIYVYFRDYMKFKDYYTLLVEVLGEERARDVDCYVLKISSQHDYAKTGEANTRYECYVYYNKDNLTIRRIRSNVWRDGKLTSGDDYGAGASTFGSDEAYPTMPIIMPTFPIAGNGSVVRSQRETEQKRRHDAGKSLPADGENWLASTKLSEVTSAANASEIVPGATPSQSATIAVSVKFMRTDIYNQSGARQHRILTETWAPGHKWWISARLGDNDPRSLATYVLDDGPAPPTK